jgi:endonuclease YncB( thermonuclease family)
MSAFFVFLTFHSIVFAKDGSNDSCPRLGNSGFEKATVKWVYDGDTLKLTDDRKIRIIGIDTPETQHHQQKAEAYGSKAREALRELLSKFNYKIELNYGLEKKDKYSRTLAHVYLPDGTNISSWLLKQGFAKTLTIPPNLELVECYHQAEKIAQNNSLGIWRLKNHQLQTATALAKNTKGYVRLKGQVKSVKKQKKYTVIELQSKNKRPIQIKIRKKDLRYFKPIQPDKLVNEYIIVSGILKNKRKKRIIQINHPTQLEVISTKSKVSSKKIMPTIQWSLQQ